MGLSLAMSHNRAREKYRHLLKLSSSLTTEIGAYLLWGLKLVCIIKLK